MKDIEKEWYQKKWKGMDKDGITTFLYKSRAINFYAHKAEIRMHMNWWHPITWVVMLVIFLLDIIDIIVQFNQRNQLFLSKEERKYSIRNLKKKL